jgi:hypothetical protein
VTRDDLDLRLADLGAGPDAVALARLLPGRAVGLLCRGDVETIPPGDAPAGVAGLVVFYWDRELPGSYCSAHLALGSTGDGGWDVRFSSSFPGHAEPAWQPDAGPGRLVPGLPGAAECLGSLFDAYFSGAEGA